MAIVLLEGFDHWDASFGNNQGGMKGWNNPGLGYHPGRLPYGAQSRSIIAAIVDAGISKSLPATYTDVYIGFGFYVDVLADLPICTIGGGGIGITSAGCMALYDNTSSLVSIGSDQIFPQTWNYAEAHFTPTHGEIRLNGLTEIASHAGAFGPNYPSVGFTFQRLGAVELRVDDLYVCDTSGGINDSYLGDIVVETLYPISDGTHTQWTADIGGAHYPRVNEFVLDEDTSYVHDVNAGDKDTYDLGNPVLGNTPVYGVQLNLGVRKNDAGSRTIAPIIRQGGADYAGNTVSVTGAYLFRSQIYDRDPTGADWLYSTVNGDEYGIELVS
jgi:hypothetical protein